MTPGGRAVNLVEVPDPKGKKRQRPALRFNDIADRMLEADPGCDLSLLQRAYVFSAKVHEGQERLSGEPYLVHPLEVAGILVDLRVDPVTVAAGLLHDTTLFRRGRLVGIDQDEWVPFDFEDPTMTHSMKRSDTSCVIICRMDNGAVMKAIHGSLRGHGNYVRIHGNKGLMENCRHGDRHRLKVWREPWEKKKGEPVETVYTPDFPVHHDQASRAGHSGGDFFTTYHFAEAIRTGEPPDLDVYTGVEMSIAGIQAWRSALDDSSPYEIPDFRKESVRRKYAKDDWSPDPERKRKGQPPSSILGRIKPSPEALALSKKVWGERGYFGK